jgi:hypothetical protein
MKTVPDIDYIYLYPKEGGEKSEIRWFRRWVPYYCCIFAPQHLVSIAISLGGRFVHPHAHHLPRLPPPPHRLGGHTSRHNLRSSFSFCFVSHGGMYVSVCAYIILNVIKWRLRIQTVNHSISENPWFYWALF